MNIILNGKYQITSDQQNYILQEKKYPNPNSKFTKDPNKWKWVDVSYHGKFEHLVNVLLEKEIKESEADELYKLYQLVCNIERTISDKIKAVS